MTCVRLALSDTSPTLNWVEKLMDDAFVREYAEAPQERWHISEKMVGVLRGYFTKGYTKFHMEQYLEEFERKRVGWLWAYRLRG